MGQILRPECSNDLLDALLIFTQEGQDFEGECRVRVYVFNSVNSLEIVLTVAVDGTFSSFARECTTTFTYHL